VIPLIYMGDGDFRASSPYHIRRCQQLYGQGELVTVEAIAERSMASHRQYFAEVGDLWETLPETLAGDFPSADHLRKFALIKSGYCKQRRLVLPTHEEAEEAALMVNELDSYALCEVTGRTLTVWVARSQSLKAMGREEFEKSKVDTLDVTRKMIGPDAYKSL
jgi:hypothetical protein